MPLISLHELHIMGKSIRQIARETNVSRNTVRKYSRANGLPERKEKPKRGSKREPFKPALDELMAAGIYMRRCCGSKFGNKATVAGKLCSPALQKK